MAKPMLKSAFESTVADATPVDVYAAREELRQIARQHGSVAKADRLSFARHMIVHVVTRYWSSIAKDLRVLPAPRLARGLLSRDQADAANRFADAVSSLEPLEAGYVIGTAYTVMLPEAFRAENGVFYTPPSLTTRLLDLATDAGVDWRTARVLDPACGGGAFLAPVAARIATIMETESASSGEIIAAIATRVRGWEIDSVSAWVSLVLLEAAVLKHVVASGVRLQGLVDVRDSLASGPTTTLDPQGWDLVIGNPPYGKITLKPDLRERYRRSLYGHANLYGLFTDLAVRICKPGGVIAYVTPTSFLAGEYFKNLRATLAEEAPPRSFDFIEDRRGVFADVLQEAMLAVYVRSGGTNA